MNFAWIMAACAYSIDFVGIWHVSICCGIVLLGEDILLFWKKRPLKFLHRLVFLCGMGVVGAWSLILAYLASQNTLECAGVPGASAELIRQATESSATLNLFQLLLVPTLLLTLVCFLVGLVVLQRPEQKHL